MKNNKPVKEIPVALAFVECRGKFLIMQRRDSNPMWDKKWEFPGGKIESGEEAKAAMARELLEETGLTANSSKFLGTYIHHWDLPEKILSVNLHCFHCVVEEGETTIEVNGDFGAYQHEWVNPSNIAEFDLLEANEDVIKKFLPEYFS